MKFKLILILFALSVGTPKVFSQSENKTFYEIKVYHFDSKEQENQLDLYLKEALLPALNRKGIKTVGVFKPVGNDTLADKRIYVLTPFKSANQFIDLPEELQKDQQFKAAGKFYLEAKHNQAPYKRMESVFLKAFAGMPTLSVPTLKNGPEKRVYELRSYESPTEEIFKNKVHMFNEGEEIDIFDRLGFNAVFYGSVISGSRMPNLMYMITFEDMASRDEHWKAFGSDAGWKKLSAMENYQNNVSKIDVLFLRPTDYSGI